MPFHPRDKLAELLGAANAHLISQKPEMDGLMVPSKFYGIIAAGRPIIFIGSPTSEMGRQVIESKLGMVMLPNSGITVIEDIKKILLLIQKEKKEVTRISAWAEIYGNRKIQTREFKSVINEVCSCQQI